MKIIEKRHKINTKSVDEAIIEGCLDYEVGKMPVYTSCGMKLPGLKMLVNMTNESPVGQSAGVTVSDRYQVIQNSEWFAIADDLVQRYSATITEAGQWDAGKYAFMKLYLGELKTPDGFRATKSVTLRVPHDGKSAVTASMGAWRQICSNGLWGWAEDRVVRVRHTRNYKEQMQEANRIMLHAHKYYEWFEGKAEVLGNAPMDRVTAAEILKKLVPDNTKVDNHSRTEKTREEMLWLYEHGKGNFGATGWDLFNGVAEHVDHKKETIRAWVGSEFGAGAKRKQDAMNLILETV